jgi:hypothetical protein
MYTSCLRNMLVPFHSNLLMPVISRYKKFGAVPRMLKINSIN